MTTTINLVQPQATSLPPEISVAEGSFDFNGTGLIPKSDGMNKLNLVEFAQADVDISIELKFNEDKFTSVFFRKKDSNNYYELHYKAGEAQVIVGRFVDGTYTLMANKPVTNRVVGFTAVLRLICTGTSMVVTIGDEEIINRPDMDFFGDEASYEPTQIRIENLSANEPTSEIRSITYNYDASSQPQEPVILSAFNAPYNLQGMARQATKRGILFNKISVYSGREYWPFPMLTNDFVGWDSDKYPMVFYSSTDHASGNGGVFLRVYEKSLGPVTDPNAWHEWQDISERPEFDHITTKTNPIFFDSNMQSETPSLFFKDGTLWLYYHNNSVAIAGMPIAQGTMFAHGTNGVDFQTQRGSYIMYNANKLEGNGHTGYFSYGENTIDEIPYKYIGKALHGGANYPQGMTDQIVVSNDLEDWRVYTTIGPALGMLENYEQAGRSGRVYMPLHVHNAKKEGYYYRVLFQNRNFVSSASIGANLPVEVLVDKDMNIVSSPNFFLDTQAGDFDEQDLGGYTEVTYEGKVYGFYKTILESGDSAFVVTETSDTPHTWEIAHPFTNKNTPLLITSDGVDAASGLNYSQTAIGFLDSEHQLYDTPYTSVTLPMDGTESVVNSTQSISLSESSFIDIKFDSIGKDSGLPTRLEFGIADNVSNPSSKLSYLFTEGDGSSADRSEPMLITHSGIDAVSDFVTDNYFGQSEEWKPNNEDEGAKSKHKIGFRIIPSRNELHVLQGSGVRGVFDISGLDYGKEYFIFIKGQLTTPQAQDSTFSFSGIKVVTSDSNPIEMPASPTLTIASKTSSSVTLATSSVAGATGYKYFLNNQQNDTGTFTDLEPETEYTVYARAVNALGDSEPSTIQTVTTDAAVVANQPPTANAGPDQSVAAATQFTLDGTGSQDTDGTIVEWRWTQTAGDTVTLNLEDPARPTATSPSKTTSQRLTFQLVTVDDEGAESSPGTVNIDVAAFAVSEMLKLLDTRTWEVENDGSVQAFEGRSNREAFRFKVTPSDGIQTSAEGYFLFDQPGVHAVEVISTPTSKISSIDDPHMIRGDVIAARIGDLKTDENGNLILTFVLYVTDDKDGLVMTAKVIEPYQKASYFRKQG